MEGTIRKMEERDVEAVRHIYVSGWQDAFRGVVPQEYLDEMDFQRWKPPIRSSYVLETGDGVVGTVAFSAGREEPYRDWGEISSIYVLPRLTGRGYGHELFQFATDSLRSDGYGRLCLTVFERNRRARKFYESHGFSWNGEVIPFEFGGKDLPVLRYTYPREDARAATSGTDA